MRCSRGRTGTRTCLRHPSELGISPLRSRADACSCICTPRFAATAFCFQAQSTSICCLCIWLACLLVPGPSASALLKAPTPDMSIGHLSMADVLSFLFVQLRRFCSNAVVVDSSIFRLLSTYAKDRRMLRICFEFSSSENYIQGFKSAEPIMNIRAMNGTRTTTAI